MRSSASIRSACAGVPFVAPSRAEDVLVDAVTIAGYCRHATRPAGCMELGNPMLRARDGTRDREAVHSKLARARKIFEQIGARRDVERVLAAGG